MKATIKKFAQNNSVKVLNAEKKVKVSGGKFYYVTHDQVEALTMEVN